MTWTKYSCGCVNCDRRCECTGECARTRMAPRVAFPGMAPVCQTCGTDWQPVRRGECIACGSDAGPLATRPIPPTERTNQ